MFGIVGPNGAGKTTTLKAPAGLVPVRERAQSTYSFGALAVCLAAAFRR